MLNVITEIALPFIIRTVRLEPSPTTV